jgi:acyl-CoA synthetase (NDP forming)
MDYLKAMKLLERFGIKFAKSILVKKPFELKKACKKIGFPIAMKVISPQVLHKSDVRGVKTGVSSLEEAERIFEQLQRNVKKRFPRAKISGILVQEMVSGQELIIGGKMDSQFGPVVLIGLGGIFVEILKDFSLRVCPISRKDAKEMISELKGFPILKGVRGQKGVNLRKLENALLKASDLMMKKKFKELDLNPVIANKKEVKVVDVRVVE